MLIKGASSDSLSINHSVHKANVLTGIRPCLIRPQCRLGPVGGAIWRELSIFDFNDFKINVDLNSIVWYIVDQSGTPEVHLTNLKLMTVS